MHQIIKVLLEQTCWWAKVTAAVHCKQLKPGHRFVRGSSFVRILPSAPVRKATSYKWLEILSLLLVTSHSADH